jgi:hypothetical protein
MERYMMQICLTDLIKRALRHSFDGCRFVSCDNESQGGGWVAQWFKLSTKDAALELSV